MGGSSSKPSEDKNEVKTNNNNEIDLTPNQIQELMVSKANLEDKVSNLENQIKYLQQQLNTYQQKTFNMQGNFQNFQNQATFNMAQAIQRMNFLETQNQLLISEKCKLQVENNSLNFELNKSKFYCNKMQVMLLNCMQKISMNENINSWQQINTPSNNNNFNNFNNLNKTPNFNYQKADNSKTIIFNVNNTIKCPVSVLPTHKLGNIFILALYQNGYTNFMNIKKFTFLYMAKNISNYFYENKEVKDLNLNFPSFPVIEVMGN